jgi:hypothetical protein
MMSQKTGNMERFTSMSEAGEITSIIVSGIIACVIILSLFTTFFDNFNKK